MTEQQLRQMCAFQLGIERRLKQAGITDQSREIVLEVSGLLAREPQATDHKILTAVKQAAALYLL